MRTVLLDYSIAKKKEPKYEFHYNYEKGLNVVNRNSMEMPFIDSPDKMVCLMSKTEAANDEKETRQFFLNINPNWAMAFDKFNRGDVKNFALSPVGSYIGTRKLSKIFCEVIPLSVFYKE